MQMKRQEYTELESYCNLLNSQELLTIQPLPAAPNLNIFPQLALRHRLQDL